MIAQIVVFFRAKLMRKERKNLRFVPQKLRKSFANGNPIRKSEFVTILNSFRIICFYFRGFSTDYLWIGLGTKVPELQTWHHICLSFNSENGEVKVIKNFIQNCKAQIFADFLLH